MANYNYAIDLLKKEEAKLLDVRDVLNCSSENSEWVNIKIKSIRNSIKALESNRGLTVTDAEGRKMTLKDGEVTISGNLTVTPINVTTTLDMINHKWDKTQVDEVSKVLNKMLKQYKDTGIDDKPKTKEEALNYLLEYNEKVKPELRITRLRYNDGKDYVQDLSYYVHPAYMSEELLDSIRKGKTLSEKLEKELSTFIIEKSI